MKNGDRVKVRCFEGDHWRFGTFIGMLDDMYVVCQDNGQLDPWEICKLVSNYSEPVKFTETNLYGCGKDDDVYTVDEWYGHVDGGSFIDYDGFGHPVKDKLANCRVNLIPSRRHRDMPDDATHVVWYNR